MEAMGSGSWQLSGTSSTPTHPNIHTWAHESYTKTTPILLVAQIPDCSGHMNANLNTTIPAQVFMLHKMRQEKCPIELMIHYVLLL